MKRRLRPQLTVFIAALYLVVAAGCSKSDKPEVSTATPQPSASASQAPASSPAKETAGDGAFACTLLTKEETAAVQGEPFKDSKASQKSSGGLAISQCYFELPTTVNSIVLTVTQKAEGTDARDPKQNWQELFHREKGPEKKEEGKEEHGPEKIEGLGDEAFWTGSRVGGALYVLKGNTFIRISIGGGGDRAEKIEKSKTLAQSVLKRL
jgi:hypothetical protein